MTAADLAEQARANGDERTARYWQRIADLVDAAPPLSRSQEDKLRILLRPDTKAASPNGAAA
ncbi:hypothetical protein [Streptomyces sp. IBSBF 2435]|uniref:hypothetical protein n=1 Tax=Streptomyces sp. IBSBF 2435 TaxID=2903531 RepID=UPI002FDC7A68